MSAYTKVIANLLFPAQERLKGHTTVAVRQALELSQWLTPPHLQALQLQRLNSLLSVAAEHVPYYRDLFARLGVKPGSFTSIAELQQLPLLTKALIVANCDAL